MPVSNLDAPLSICLPPCLRGLLQEAREQTAGNSSQLGQTDKAADPEGFWRLNWLGCGWQQGWQRPVSDYVCACRRHLSHLRPLHAPWPAAAALRGPATANHRALPHC